MGVNVNGVSANTAAVYSSGQKEVDSSAKTTNKEVQNEVGATYEKSNSQETKAATYSVNKMSAEDRQALVTRLKEDMESRKSQLLDIIRQMMGKQANTAAIASEDDLWKFLAGGNLSVDAETKAQAQADIAEDGYWGVKQTSQRMFDFASALAGDDVDKMKEMQEAMMKGYEQAQKAWGGELPQISQDTIAAANKLFEDYYASKQ